VTIPHLSLSTIAWITPPAFMREKLLAIAAGLPMRTIGSNGSTYLERYTVCQLPRGGEQYLHRFLRSDADQELHSHPWCARSTILYGGYREERRQPDDSVAVREYRQGDENLLTPSTFHRVDLLSDECWSLITVGPKAASWSFWDRYSGVETPWREFVQAREKGVQ
jgi:hypothetical protein